MANEVQARRILSGLEQAGYEAYFVGGCVRDLLLGRPIHDWDITTSARPEQIMAVFAHCIPTGLQHGTVTVCEDGQTYEVTTFRADGDYLDGRHPENVSFVSDLAHDLERRDFTINAMAMDLRGNLTDLWDSRADLEQKTIRCVGDPVRRFEEDALRMLRAIRFSAQLGFTIEPHTVQAMKHCAHLCAHLSAERIRDEVEKTLLSPRPEAVGDMVRLGMLNHRNVFGEHNLDSLRAVPCERTVRWAALKLALPDLDLTALRLDRKTCDLCAETAAIFRPQWEILPLKRLVAERGWDVAMCACKMSGQESMLESLRRSGQCVTLRQLAVTGRDLPWLSGPAVGQMLRQLLNHVLEHPESNSRENLLELAKRIFAQQKTDG